MSTWYKDNLLQANPITYQTLTIKSKSQVWNKKRINLNLGGSNIKSSSCLKLLGVNVDEDLEFKEHILSKICENKQAKKHDSNSCQDAVV
jgi:hypothetical protein